MLKKALIAVSMLFATTGIAFADIHPYVGADLGLNNENVKLIDQTSARTNFDELGVLGGTFGGISVSSEHTYLALEGFVNGNALHTGSKTIRTRTGTTSASLSQDYTYGVSLVPGVKFKNVMLYGRLGVVRTKYEAKESPAPAGYASSESHSTNGAQAGLGLQANVSEHVSLRGEYDYTVYRKFSAYGNTIYPRDNQVKVGLVYNFG